MKWLIRMTLAPFMRFATIYSARMVDIFLAAAKDIYISHAINLNSPLQTHLPRFSLAGGGNRNK